MFYLKYNNTRPDPVSRWGQAAARPDLTPPDGATLGAEEEADGVTAARGWRVVCRLDHWRLCELPKGKG